jgi:hypothetical protein
MFIHRLLCLYKYGKLRNMTYRLREDGGGIKLFHLQYSLLLGNYLDFPNVLYFHAFLDLFSLLARCLSCILHVYQGYAFSLFYEIYVTYI